MSELFEKKYDHRSQVDFLSLHYIRLFAIAIYEVKNNISTLIMPELFEKNMTIAHRKMDTYTVTYSLKFLKYFVGKVWNLFSLK